MRKPPPLPEGSTEKLRVALKGARTKSQYQQVLCLWLRAVLQMNSDLIGIALGLTACGVRGVWTRYLHEGEAMFERPGKGGPHRQNLTREAEREFLDRLLKQTLPANAVMDARFIQEAYERLLDRPVTYSVIRRLLKRHGWRPVQLGHIATPRGWAAAKIR